MEVRYKVVTNEVHYEPSFEDAVRLAGAYLGPQLEPLSWRDGMQVTITRLHTVSGDEPMPPKDAPPAKMVKRKTAFKRRKSLTSAFIKSRR